MSSPYEDKPGGGDSTPPGGAGSSSTTTPAPALVSTSGPVAPAGEATWGTQPGLNVRYAGRTAVGLVREHNEDNFVIANLTSGELGAREASLTDVVGEGGLLFAVCDGMGGAAAGEVASQMAVDVLHEAMRRGGFPKERDVLARRLVSAVEEAGRRIFDAAQKERSRRGMGTTATAAVLIDKVLFVAEVGDSRAYLLRNGQLKQLTKDQSLVNQLIEAGHLTEAEAEAFEHSNIILQALGTSETVQVDLTFVELRRGDRLMICSDGLSGLVHADTLRDTLAAIDDPSECTAALVRFAEASGGHDNITVVVIDFDGEVLELPRDTDSFGYLQYPLVPATSAASTFADEEVTEAARPLSMGGYDAIPPYSPPAGPRVDTNPWLWISAGLAALLVGAWLLAVGDEASNSATARELEVGAAAPDEAADAVLAPAQPALGEEAAGEQSDTAEVAATATSATAKVPVHVYSDVEDAVLLVNGEVHGPLATEEGQSLDLVPGAYRFEARSRNNVAATAVVNVRADEPVDVYLRLPSGANEPGKTGTVAQQADRSAGAAKSAPVQGPKSGSAQAGRVEARSSTPAAPDVKKNATKDSTKDATKNATKDGMKADVAKADVTKAGATNAQVAKPAAAEPETAKPGSNPSPGALTAPSATTAPAPSKVAPRTAPAADTTPQTPALSAPAPRVAVPAPGSSAPKGAAQPSAPQPTAAPKVNPPPAPKPDSPIPENPF